ncbi:MAG: restriction endonuclease subunit S [Sphingopyxis granuli]|uniref:restriction endonuclease subunit S n=1 Tax=Sphingopyxis granuli TaxID=267128 RepID=UPI003C74843A
MDSQKFLDAFGHIADAPGGVARLRELILQLAISGSLVPKDENDASVETDLAQARKLHSEYVEAFELRKTVPHPLIENFPFPVPSHWAWERLERLCLYIQRGKGPSYVDRSSTRVISQKCVQWSGFDLAPSRFVSDDAIQGYGPERLLRKGDLLWNSTGTGTAGRIAIYDIKEPISAVADSHLTVIRLANFEPRYVWCVIGAPWIQVRINPDHPDSLVSGTTQQVELAINAVRALEIPCPPIGEQKRIVAKVDELMALCDQLEKQQEARRGLQVKARKALIQIVASASASDEVLSGWGKLTDHFADLFSSPEDVEDLRGLVSDLAIRGLLLDSVSKNSADAVERLLQGIAAKKSGKRFAKALRPETDYDLPLGWRWVLLEDLLKGSESGWSPKCDAEARRPGEFGVLKVSAVTWGEFRPDENKRLPGSMEPRLECVVKPADFLITRANTAELVARSVIVPNDCPPGLMMSDKIVRLNFIEDTLKPWVNFVNNSDLSRAYYKSKATGTSDSMRNVSREVIHELPIPLPPLDVQQTLMRAVSRMSSICGELAQQFQVKQKLGSSLAQAAVSNITGIAVTQEEAELKAPQTELIATLCLGTPPSGSSQAPLASILVRHSGALSAKDLWQRFGGEIDSFYAQLKHEVVHGWIVEPKVAEMREQETA